MNTIKKSKHTNIHNRRKTTKRKHNRTKRTNKRIKPKRRNIHNKSNNKKPHVYWKIHKKINYFKSFLALIK